MSKRQQQLQLRLTLSQSLEDKLMTTYLPTTATVSDAIAAAVDALTLPLIDSKLFHLRQFGDEYKLQQKIKGSVSCETCSRRVSGEWASSPCSHGRGNQSAHYDQWGARIDGN